MQGTRVEEGAIHTFAQQADQAGNDLQATINTLMDQLAATASTWVGLGGTSFVNTNNIVRDRANKMNLELDGLAQDLMTIGNAYSASDESQADTINRSQATFGGIAEGLS